MNILFKLIEFIRYLSTSAMTWFSTKIRDPDTGKFIIEVKYVKVIMIVVAVSVFLFFVIYNMINSEIKLKNGIDDFDAELKNSTNIQATEVEVGNMSDDPLANILRDSSPEKNDKKVETTTFDKAVCTKLLDALREGSSLNMDQKYKLKECLEHADELGMSQQDVDVVKKIAELGTLSSDEKNALNEIFGTDQKCQTVIEETMMDQTGNNLLNEIYGETDLSKKVAEAISKDEMAKQMVLANEKTISENFSITEAEAKLLKKIIDECDMSTLKKMLTDPKYKELMQKLVKESQNDPNFIKNALKNQALSNEAKDLLRRLAAGGISETDPEYRIAKALMSGDKNKIDLAEGILAANKLGDDSLRDALTKKLTGDRMTPEEMKLVKETNLGKLIEAGKTFDKDPSLAAIQLKDAKGEKLSDEEKKKLAGLSNNVINGDIQAPTGVDRDKYIQELAKVIAARQAELDKMKDDLIKAQMAAKDAADKLKEGAKLTDEQADAIQKFAELQKKLREAEAENEKNKARLAKEALSLQKTINSASAMMQEMYPSGITVEEEGIQLNTCKALPMKIIKKVKKASKPKKTIEITDASGRALSEEQLKFLKFYKKEKDKIIARAKEIEGAAFNPMTGGNSFISSTSSSGEGSTTAGDINAGFSFAGGGKDKVAFTLAPELAIPAQLLTEILVSDKGSEQKIKFQILADVFDITGRVVIPRNSIVLARATTGFDVDTAKMNIRTAGVSVGGKLVDYSFSVNSADNSSGLSGQVRDTKGKLLAGMFVASFSAGAISAISQTLISPYQDSEYIQDTLTGAALQGTAEVAQRIAEMYANDLQQAARIFYVPKGVKVILDPSP